MSSGWQRPRTRRRRTPRRSSRRSGRTSSSRQGEFRSGPMTSSGACRRDLGVEEVFWGVAMRPGKPLAFGCPRQDARLRTPRQSGLDARRSSPLRPAGAPRAPGPSRSGAAVSARCPGHGRPAAARAGRLRTRTNHLGRRRRPDRPDRRAGIAHDRRRRPPPRRLPGSRREPACSTPELRCASSCSDAGARPSPRAGSGPPRALRAATRRQPRRSGRGRSARGRSRESSARRGRAAC